MTGIRLLLVDGSVARRGDLAFDLESRQGFLVTQAAGQTDALARLAMEPFAVVVMAASLPDGDAIGILHRIAHRAPEAPVTLVLLQAGEHGLGRLAWAEGVTAVLTDPVDPSELSAALRTLLRVRGERIQEAAARERMAASMDRLTHLLVLILDSVVPGAARRGVEAANLASSLAQGFELPPPMLDELRQAARLHELGRLTMGRGAPGRSGAAGYVSLASAQMLSDVPCLQEIADLIEGIGANWDGSGIPAGRQRGEIPLRSRLLRVSIDLLAVIEQTGRAGPEALSSATARLLPESGRLYDPAVIAVLEALAATEVVPAWHAASAWVDYDGLAEGMELAADLHTLSGVKLLSAGSVLNASTLQLIRHRHELDPLALPVSIQGRGSPLARAGSGRPPAR